MILSMNLGENSYDIVIDTGCLQRAETLLCLQRKVLIVTDEGVPKEYAETLAEKCLEPAIVTVPQGEGSKSIRIWEKLLQTMLDRGFLRTDAVVGIGGGVVGDLSGFAAASYMRGIDFYNIPTTVLSQVDSSIGGKTAVNFGGIKNIVGAFYQPKKVLVDPELHRTLSKRQTANGLAEALKMAACFDEELFSLFERGDPYAKLPEIITRSLEIKKMVVEQDEREQGLRKALNFGHTIGHGIESVTGLLHGECVALGMIPMSSGKVRERIVPALLKLGLPVSVQADREQVLSAVMHDKKAVSGGITCVLCEEIGRFRLQKLSEEEIRERLFAGIRE